MSDDIPEELISDILSRLQVSSCIARFRCVCKSWRDLLSDPAFIRKNLWNSSSGHYQTMIEWNKETYLEVHSWHFSDDSLEPLQLPFDPDKVSKNGTRSSLRVAGCCNGLFCITQWGRKEWYMILWNPVTSEFKVLLPSPSDDLNPNFAIGGVGFGFDSKTNDYKVVRQFNFGAGFVYGCHYISEVYSLRNNSWKKFVGDGGCPPLTNMVISEYHKGKLYWWHSRRGKSLVFDSFDISSEVFQVIDVPYASEKLYDTPECFFNEESMVAVFPEYSEESMSTMWDVWVLLKYWVSESWIKLYVVKSPPGITINYCAGLSRNLKFFFAAIPSNLLDEDGVYFGDRIIIVFDPKTGNFSNLEIKGNWLKVITNYVPSRVSLQDCFSSS